MTDFISDKECPIDSAGKIVPAKDSELAVSFIVKYSDIDINKHLNSMKYIEHFVDIFPLELYQKKEIKGFEINYIIEGKYASELSIFKKEISDNIYSLDMRHDDKAICVARVTWK